MGASLSVVEIAVRLLAAVVFSGVMGWERESRQRPAGLRTHMMVGLGASSFTLMAVQMAGPAADPVRVLQGVVTGIGFLGAGSIMQSRGEVQGMTTAAGIWVVGAIGAACGLGSYIIGGVVLACAMVILTVLRRLEEHAFPENQTVRRSEDGEDSPRR